MTDTILETLAKLNDLSKWDVKYNVPIFSEHEMWEIPDPTNPASTVRVAILPDQPKPNAGKFLYAVGETDLKKIVLNMNRRMNEGTPATIFIGHSNPALPQKYQPDCVGYGVGAELKRVGPKGRLCIVTRQQLDKSKAVEAKSFPKRSAEYNYLTGDLTGYGLFKTDVKLPLGDILYSSNVGAHIGQFHGFQCYSKDASTVLYAEMPGMDGEGEQSKEGSDPSAPPDATELQGPERQMADRFMKHYEQNHPVMRYMCTMHQQQMAAQAPGQPPGAPPNTPGAAPPVPPGVGTMPQEKPKEPEKPRSPETETSMKMSQDVAQVQYAQLANEVTQLKAQNAQMLAVLETLKGTNQALTQNYATEQSKRLLVELANEGYKFNAQKELERLVKMNDAARVDYANNIRENYARADMAPTGPMLGIFDGNVTQPKKSQHPEVQTKDETSAVVAYAEKNNIDLENDGAFEKCLEAIRKRAG